MLDFDGTLVPLAPRPQDIVVPPTVVQLLQALNRIPFVEVAIVSGRHVSDLEFYLPGGSLTLVGSHGGETRYPDRPTRSVRTSEAYNAVAREVRTKCRQDVVHWPGCAIEDKPQGFALHYRCATRPVATQAVSALVGYARTAVESHIAQITHGDQVAEFRPVGINKGSAVCALLERAERDTFPVFIGDDRTDEDAFRAMGARGMTVLVSNHARPTYARARAANPDAVVQTLRSCLSEWSRNGPDPNSLRFDSQVRLDHAAIP